jgi:hypothetical protein
MRLDPECLFGTVGTTGQATGQQKMVISREHVVVSTTEGGVCWTLFERQ